MSCAATSSSTSTSNEEAPQPNNSDSCILCVGYCVLDIIHQCDEYPEEDAKKLSITGYWQRGGNCSNMCTVLRNFNANCEYLGMMSSSPGFVFLRQDCNKRSIEIKNCPKTTQEPPFSTIILSLATGSRTAIHSGNKFPILKYEHFCNLDLNDYTWINFEARDAEQQKQMLLHVCRFNRNYRNDSDKIPISLDLEQKFEELISLAEYVDYVIMGKELAKLMGWATPYAAVHGLRQKLKTQEITGFSKPNIIAPWGADGAAYLSSIDEYEMLPAQPPRVIVDTLGAGDTFCASLVFALHILGKNLRNSVIFANHIAGFKIGHRGYDQIKEYFAKYSKFCAA